MGETVCIQPSGLHEKEGKPWRLVFRNHDLGGVGIEAICLLDDDQARRIVEAKGVYWRYGEPDWNKRARLREEERIRVARERLDAEEAALKEAVGS